MKYTKATFLGIGLALLLITVAPGMQSSAFGQREVVDRDPRTNAIYSRIVGLWDVQVTVENCVTGAPMTSFAALHKYELGGTGQVVPATNPANLSAHLTIWDHVGGNDYVMAQKMYRFNSTGSYIGYTVIRLNVNIANGLYSGSGVAEIYDT
jgi:hypothetical protein